MSHVRTIGREKLLEYLKTHDEPCSKKTIVGETGFKGDFSYNIGILMKENPQIVRIGVAGRAAYIYKKDKDVSPSVASEMKNPEGYSDYTAGKAIANVMKSSGRYPMRQRFGDVWSSRTASDDMEGCLVLGSADGVCICLNVYPTRRAFMKKDHTLSWTDKIGTHYISLLNVVNINESKLGRKTSEAPDNIKEAVTNYMQLFLNIKPSSQVVEIEVEKPVEKIVEVEKEVIKEVLVEVPDQKEIELAVLKTKCEIYENLIFGEKAGGNREWSQF